MLPTECHRPWASYCQLQHIKTGLIIVLLQLSDDVVVSEMERETGDASNYQYYEWFKNLTIPVIEMSDETTYRCTAKIGQMSSHALYSFSVVGICLRLLIVMLC